MKITMQILLLLSLVYSLKADGNINSDKKYFEDYSSIELVVRPKDGAKDKAFDEDDAYLNYSTSEEVDIAPKISVQYKDSREERSGKKHIPAAKSTKDTGTSLIHKNVTETLVSDPIERNKTVKGKGNKKNIKSKIAEKTVLEHSTPKSITTTKDDMDDLIYDSENYKKSYDDDDDDRNLRSEIHTTPSDNDSEPDGLDDDFRPSRRMFDPVPVLDYREGKESYKLLEPINTPLGAGSSPHNIHVPTSLPNQAESIRLKSNRPPPSNYYQKPSIRFSNDPYQGYHFPTMSAQVDYYNQGRLHDDSQEVLMNPHKFERLDEIENEPTPVRFEDSREMVNINSREGLLGTTTFYNAEASIPIIPDRFGTSQEMISPQNRMAEEPPNESDWRQPPEPYNVPSRWMPHVTMAPNKWLQGPDIQNIPNKWVYPRTLNTPIPFNPKITDTRIMQPQEAYNPVDLNSNAVSPSEQNPSDSNAYPYISLKAKTEETNMNPIFRKLVQASNPPQPPNPITQLPMYGLLGYPGYPSFDPRFIARQNPRVPRSQRFLIGNGYQFNPLCCN